MAVLLETVRNMGQPIGTGWARMDRRQRIVVVGISLTVLCGLLALILRARTVEYTPLYANLQDTDAAEVAAALRENGVRYRLGAQGTAILVPKDDVYQTRLDLAAKGLPRGGVVGFEIFQQFSFGNTDFERNVKYAWALQGELTRTIRAYDAVEDARVHIVIPERTLFLREQRPPSASVLLQLNPGAVLSRAQVNSIAFLVARSVESLKPEDVTIVDTSGNLLSQPNDTSVVDGSAAMQRLEIQRAFERDLEAHLQSMLESVYGSGRALVRVKSDMSFDSEEETQQVFAPAAPEGLARTSRTEEELTTSQPTAGGVAGVTSGTAGDLASYVIPDSAPQASTHERRSSEVNYEVNRTERHRVVAPGRVLGLSVAVWIDGDLTEAEKDQVRSTIAAAIGGAGDRQGDVTVESMPFRSRFESETAAADGLGSPASQPTSSWGRLSVWAAGGALLGLLVLGSYLLLSRRQQRSYVDVTLPELAATAEETTVIEPSDDAKRRKQVETLARERPAEFANLVRYWLAADETEGGS